MSIRSGHRSASAVREDTLITGTSARPYGEPSPVVKICMFIEASCWVPQMKSLAGVAAKTRPLAVTRSPCVATYRSAVEPAFATEPSAFSTTLESPPRLLPGVGLRSEEHTSELQSQS